MTDLYPNLFKNLTRNPITVVLLDGRKQMMVYDKTTKLNTLFKETCSLCNLDCDNLFGFASLMDDYYAFLNLDTKVSKLDFKEISRKSQNNILFQSNLTCYGPVHRIFEDSRRLSQGDTITRDNSNKLLQSTSSTKSAPVYHLHDTLTPPQNNTPVIYFRVRSYVDSHCLRDKTTKSLYFLQLLRNVLDYRLKCVDEIYLQLGSLAIQAFFGDYTGLVSSSNDVRSSATSSNTESSDYSNSSSLKRLSARSFNFTAEEIGSGRYFEPKKFFPLWIIEKYSEDYLYKEIPQLHKGLGGISRIEVEFSFIRMASAQYSNFNMHLLPVREQKMSGSHLPVPSIPGTKKRNGMNAVKNSLWLGLSPAGLEMHQMKRSEYIEHISVLKWSDIDEITHKSSRIYVRVGCRNLKLYTNTKMQADHLFWLTRHMHMYQTKARLNATCTEESLENAERQKYREKYVYQDLEDLKLHGLPTSCSIDSSETTSNKDPYDITPAVVRLPLVSTPAPLPRRTPSKAKPMKMKDLVKMANSSNDSRDGSPVGSLHTEKHSQYIKKSKPITCTHPGSHGPVAQKPLKSPDITPRSVKDHQDSDQGSITDMIDDSDDLSRSSALCAIVKSPGRFVSLTRDLSEGDNIVPPPAQFRESIIVRSASVTHRQNQSSDDKGDNRVAGGATTVSVTLKSWKSELLFNLSMDDTEPGLHCLMRGREDRVSSLPRHIGSYRDLISLSSSSTSLSGDSVEISSISSFEMNEIKYSRIPGESILNSRSPVVQFLSVNQS